ncbi:MAG TPA: sulfoacetate transporter [Parvularcula sp.]|nr:sulfoacetate transporter [Parvularcula sp.]
MAALVFAFLLVALVYASVGFGGGSTYNALLVLSDVDYRILPAIALACNIVVVAGGVVHFGSRRLIPWRRIAPWIIASAPAAFIGGMLHIPERAFLAILGSALVIAGAQLILRRAPSTPPPPHRPGRASTFAGGASLGLLAGVTGVGGGIILAPLLHWLRWGPPRQIAGAASLFILVNSLSGLAGQATKLAETNMAALAASYWPLLAGVLVGGQIGSRLGAAGMPDAWLRRITGVVVLYAAARLLLQFWSSS